MDMRDTMELMKLAKRAEKQNSYASAEHTLKIAVLGTYSIQYVVKGLRYILFADFHVNAEIWEGDYDGIAKTLLDDSSDYYAFHPDITVLLPDCTTIDIEFYKNLWQRIPGYIIQSNFVVPTITQFGNLEMNLTTSRNFQIAASNLEFIRQKPNNLLFLDFDGLASRVGKDRWFDYPAYFSTKQGVCLDFLGDVCELIARQVGAVLGKTKKCLILDLDNTLWGGVVGDDGYDGIMLDPNDSLGEAYRFFQKYILSLKERGVILSVCSKNNEATAKEPFEKNSNMLIKLTDISCFTANWDDKVTNIRRIAEELNIGIDSLVFFDDNPAEREIVRMHLPEVTVVDVPEDPAYYAKALSDAGVFDWLQITNEDLTRTKSYLSNSSRAELERAAVDYDAYLNALDMNYDIGYLDAKRVPRFAQLINKTNQFNLRTQRYTAAEITEMLSNPQYQLIYVELSDKFDNYGLISCVIIKDNFIDTWVMSCRVFKRRVEEHVFAFILENTTGSLYSEYKPTAKNGLVKNFYKTLGFRESGQEGEYIYERI